MANPIVQKAATSAGKAAVKSASDSFTPAWAQEQAYQPPNVPGVKDEAKPEKKSWFSKSSSSTNDADVEDQSRDKSNRITSTEEDVVMTAEELSTLGKYHIAIRLAYMASAILMSFSGIWYLLNQKAPALGIIFFAVYVFGFSLLLFCFECGLSTIMQTIASNFGFLYTIIGRCTFCLFVGFMCYQFNAPGYAAMGLLFATLLFHCYVMFKFPKFSAYLRKKHFNTQ